MLGGRSTVGHVALDHVIGVQIPASQPSPNVKSQDTNTFVSKTIFTERSEPL